MSEEWTEWREHDGKSIPLPGGILAQMEFDDGEFLEEPIINPVPKICQSCFVWADDDRYGERIIRYRIRKPKALEQLRNIARDVETPLVNTPKEPVREGV